MSGEGSVVSIHPTDYSHPTACRLMKQRLMHAHYVQNCAPNELASRERQMDVI